MLRWLFLLFLGMLAHTIVYFPMFWQVQNADKLQLIGYAFRNMYVFWGAYALFLSVLYYPANYIFIAAYWYGYHVVFPGTMWLVALTSSLSSTIILLIAIGWYFRELPAGNALIALLGLGIAVVALHWK